jgi:glycerophosphoryl diester phosphodiesterase
VAELRQEGRARTLIDLGVDGIITDSPDRLREVIAEKMTLP